MIYRFYLGKDNTSDFSVIRNSDMLVTLTLTGEGLTEISWKVEPDVEVQPGYTDGYIDESLHPADDMYIGEKFWYYMDVHPNLVTHLGGDLDKCSLTLVSSDGGSIKFDEYDNDSSRGVMYARGTCWSKGTGTIWLCDPSGNPVTEVSQRFNIQKPRMVASFYSSVRYGDDDIACDEQTIPLSVGIDLYNDDDDHTIQIQKLYDRINRLDSFDRAIILLWLENMTYQEIANVVGITLSNVTTRLFRIKEQLKAMSNKK